VSAHQLISSSPAAALVITMPPLSKFSVSPGIDATTFGAGAITEKLESLLLARVQALATLSHMATRRFPTHVLPLRIDFIDYATDTRFFSAPSVPVSLRWLKEGRTPYQKTCRPGSSSMYRTL
jgi:hypothetical protein